MISEGKKRVTVTLSNERITELYALGTIYHMTPSELVEQLIMAMWDAAQAGEGPAGGD